MIRGLWSRKTETIATTPENVAVAWEKIDAAPAQATDVPAKAATPAPLSIAPKQNPPEEHEQMSFEPTASKAAGGPSPGERQPATIRYLDRPDMGETFADSVTGLIFDGQTLRIEFGVTRFDEVKAGAPITGRRYPACRLVLPPAAAVDLINRMQQIANALTQAGVVKPTPRPVSEPPKPGK
jgi:hypothetical protein